MYGDLSDRYLVVKNSNKNTKHRRGDGRESLFWRADIRALLSLLSNKEKEKLEEDCDLPWVKSGGD